MAANVETMFYVKEKPWHGLGERVEEALNSKDALRMAGLDWTVDQHDVVVDGVVVPNYKANVRSSDNKVLGIVSNRYKIVQNVDAFEFTDAIIGNGEIEVKYETAGCLANGKRVWMLAKMPDVDVMGDVVEPYMVFTNTHDGSGSIKVAMTPVRVVCQNTLTLALNKANRIWTTKHMGDMESKMHEAEISLGLAKAYMEEFTETAEILQQKHISDNVLTEFLEIAFPIPKFDNNLPIDRKVANAIYMRDTFLSWYKSIDDVAKFRRTGWELYNLMSDFISHMTPLRNTKSLAENRFMSMVDGNKSLQLTQDFIMGL